MKKLISLALIASIFCSVQAEVTPEAIKIKEYGGCLEIRTDDLTIHTEKSTGKITSLFTLNGVKWGVCLVSTFIPLTAYLLSRNPWIQATEQQLAAAKIAKATKTRGANVAQAVAMRAIASVEEMRRKFPVYKMFNRRTNYVAIPLSVLGAGATLWYYIKMHLAHPQLIEQLQSSQFQDAVNKACRARRQKAPDWSTLDVRMLDAIKK